MVLYRSTATVQGSKGDRLIEYLSSNCAPVYHHGCHRLSVGSRKGRPAS
jgi:hypothetical protein